MKASLKNKVGNFPDFLVVGAAKSGTTSIQEYLSNHPDIFLPPEKELHFWHGNRNPDKEILKYWCSVRAIPTTLSEYQAYYEKAKGHQLIGEVCPSYLYYHQYVIDSLKDYHPSWKKVKIIIILREPVSRTLSQYRYTRSKFLDPENLSLKHILAAKDKKNKNAVILDIFYRDLSRYTKQVSAYLNAFDNVFVCLYDELKNDPNTLMEKICGFLEIDSNKIKLPESLIFNKSDPILIYRGEMAKKFYQFARKAGLNLSDNIKEKVKLFLNSILSKKEEEVSEDIIYMLKNEFKQEIIELEKIIEMDLSSWK